MIMTHNVAHSNKMLFDLKEQYQTQIQRLQSKIEEQEQEIAKLKTMITLLSTERDYDC
jgi:cell division protein FtsL